MLASVTKTRKKLRHWHIQQENCSLVSALKKEWNAWPVQTEDALCIADAALSGNGAHLSCSTVLPLRCQLHACHNGCVRGHGGNYGHPTAAGGHLYLHCCHQNFSSPGPPGGRAHSGTQGVHALREEQDAGSVKSLFLPFSTLCLFHSWIFSLHVLPVHDACVHSGCVWQRKVE